MKKIILSFAVLANLGFANDYDFRMGFEAGLKATEFQRKNEGIQPRKIFINSPYIVVFDTENTDISEVLFLQQVAHKDGFKTYLTENSLFFGGFDRKADANSAMKRINREYNIKSVVKSTSNGIWIVTYPNLWKHASNDFLNLAKNQGYALKTQVLQTEKIVEKPIIKKQYITKKIIQKAKADSPILVKKTMTLKNQKAMSYKLNGDNSDSKNFKEYQFLSGSFELENDKEIKTNQGEGFYKVKGENLYFNTLDIGDIK